MCLAIPARVVELLDDTMIRVTIGNGSTCLTASALLLSQPLEVGDYVIVHAGFAMHKLETSEAEESLRLFRELTAVHSEENTF